MSASVSPARSPSEAGPGGRVLHDVVDGLRHALLEAVEGLDERTLRAPVGWGWSPLGLVTHLGWQERRWVRGTLTPGVPHPVHPAGGPSAEWAVPDGRSTWSVLAAYLDELRGCREAVADGGRFVVERVLVRMVSEYARHLGELDALVIGAAACAPAGTRPPPGA